MNMAKRKSLPVRSNDIPATLGMLHLVRDELKSDISSLEFKMSRGFLKVDSRFAEVTSEMSGLKADIAEMKSNMLQMRILAEEQRAENRIVMDGLTSLFSRQDRCEIRIDSVEKLVRNLKG
jgi:hypothetical protein